MDDWEVVAGASGQPLSAEVLPVHAALLPSGKVLYFSGSQHDEAAKAPFDATRLYVPGSRRIEAPSSPNADLFCCGHCLLPDGNVLVTGGTEAYDNEASPVHRAEHHFTGLKTTHIFDWITEQWSKVGDMAEGRWYPTCITLPNGQALAASGHTSGASALHENDTIEFFDPVARAWSLPFATLPSLEETGSYDLAIKIFGIGPFHKIVHPEVYYPRLHILPNGQVFCSTALQVAKVRMTRAFNPNDRVLVTMTGPPYTPGIVFIPGIGLPVGDPEGVAAMENTYARSAFASVLLPLRPPSYTAKILICGQKQAKLFDTSSAATRSLGWQDAGAPRPYPVRAYLNAVLLPDGTVLVLGGIGSEKGPFGRLDISHGVDGLEPESIGGLDADAIFTAEVYTPETNSWQVLSTSPNKIPRGYHSVALLLPDGRVWLAGSNHDAERNLNGVREDDAGRGDARELRMELYSPPYLFTTDPVTGQRIPAARPQLVWAPETIGYGQQFTILTPDANDVFNVALIRCSSATHAFNPDQRYVQLTIDQFSRTPNTLTVTAPPTPEIAPPGYYLIFAVTLAGVPSVGRFLRLETVHAIMDVSVDRGAGLGKQLLIAGDRWYPGSVGEIELARRDVGVHTSFLVYCEVRGGGSVLLRTARVSSGLAGGVVQFNGQPAFNATVSSTHPVVVTVSFTLTDYLPHAAVLTLETDSPNFQPYVPGTTQITLGFTVRGEGVHVELTPDPLDFGTVAAGASNALEVGVANRGAQDVTVALELTDGADGQFLISDTLVALGVGQARTIPVAFVPTTVGRVAGRLHAHAASISQQTRYQEDAFLELHGTGTGPRADLTPALLTFPTQLGHTTSQAQAVTLTNNGSSPLLIADVTTDYEFSQTNTCPAVLAPGAACTIEVRFHPAGPGNRSGRLLVRSSAPGTPSLVQLAGTSVSEPIAILDPVSLDFGDQPVGTRGATLSITVRNDGAPDLLINSISLAGPHATDFTIVDNPTGQLVPPEQTSQLGIAFRPQAPGVRTATLCLEDNTSGSPHAVNLTGEGTAAPPLVADPTILAFPAQPVGAAGAPQSLLIRNAGPAVLYVAEPQIAGPHAGDFRVTQNDCRTALPPGGTCPLEVTFAPQAPGLRMASLIVSAGNEATTREIALTGTGLGATGRFDPPDVAFGDERVGTASPLVVITFSNEGTAALEVHSITVTGDFIHTTNCPAVLPPGAHGIINMRFLPSTAGMRTGQLTVVDGQGASIAATLTGKGIQSILGLSDDRIDFGPIPIGTAVARVLTITNEGDAPLTIQDVTIGGGNAVDFTIEANTCTGSVLQAGESCTVRVQFSPTTKGPRTATLAFSDNAADSPQVVGLSGEGYQGPA
jgi:hypothetical protein